MDQKPDSSNQRVRWWQSFGPALITACVVLGPGSLLVSSNLGAKYGYELLWILAITGVLMATYVSMAARIGVVGGASPCTLVAQQAGRGFAVVIGLNLCLICSVFQFANNLAFSAAIEALFPKWGSVWPIIVMNALVIVMLLLTRNIYRFLEKLMKFMVGLMVLCFVANLFFAKPSLAGVLKGFIPHMPEGVHLGIPHKVDGRINDPMLLIASLLGTTFSVAGAFYQGNLVREKGWDMQDYRRGIGDSIFGVSILTGIAAVIMITTATVIPGQSADNIGALSQSLQPLLGSKAYILFCIGLLAVSINPFMINSMIGGSMLADGLGKPARLSNFWPRVFTILVLLIGMTVAILAMQTGQKPITLIIIGQALTVLGNPLMAGTLLWLANSKAVMKDKRNSLLINILAGTGFLVTVFMAFRVLCLVILKIT